MATIRLGGHAQGCLLKSNSAILNPTNSANGLSFKRLVSILNVSQGDGAIVPQVGGQAVLGRQDASPTPWLTERHGYDPT